MIKKLSDQSLEQFLSEQITRKFPARGAKAQRGKVIVFLCAFAPLREIVFL
jgi:hypothetical protein